MQPLPTVIGPAGLVPQAPSDIKDALLAQLDDIIPGAVTRLPFLLLEDISSTDVAAIAQCDRARVEFVNSLTPKGANAWLLLQLGVQAGIKPGEPTNTSVQVIFTAPGSAGFVIPRGFVVSDGVYSYIVQDGGVIGAGFQSPPLLAIATEPGTWAVPAGIVTSMGSSVPSYIPLTVSNPYPGTPSIAAEDETSYRARVLDAELASAQGMPSFLRTNINNVAGVEPRLVSMQQQIGGGWKILVGGSGDPYQIAWAIYSGIADISSLVQSSMFVENITQGPNAVVTTTLNHGLSTGQTAYVDNLELGMVALNGLPLTITVVDEKNFSIGIDTTSFGPYEGGGVVFPNYRNNAVSLNVYPDVYSIVFVSPPLQTVNIAVTWNTTEVNFVNASAVEQLAGPALADYVNSVAVGQPLNQLVMTRVFQDAITSILSPDLLTRLIFEVSINGVGTALTAGTAEYNGDSESYFYSDPTGLGMTITQG